MVKAEDSRPRGRGFEPRQVPYTRWMLCWLFHLASFWMTCYAQLMGSWGLKPVTYFLGHLVRLNLCMITRNLELDSNMKMCDFSWVKYFEFNFPKKIWIVISIALVLLKSHLKSSTSEFRLVTTDYSNFNDR